jgi:hypothetical protein
MGWTAEDRTMTAQAGLPLRRRRGPARLVAALAALWLFVFFMVTALVR